MIIKTDLSVSKVIDVVSTLVGEKEVIDLKYVVKNRRNMAEISVYENLESSKDKKNFYLIHISDLNERTIISMDFEKYHNEAKKVCIKNRYKEIF